MRRFAFFLSSEKYQDYSDTPYCHADSELLRNTLITSCDYLPENSVLLKLEKGDGITAEKIIGEVAGLVERADVGDSILFFYAGHGVAIDSKTYLVLPDTSRFNESNTSLKLSDVSYYLSKNKRLNIRIFDCCHSGEDSRSPGTEPATQEFMRVVLSEGVDCSITLASCAAHEKSYWDEATGNGVFTGALVNAINVHKKETDIHAETLKIDVCNSVQQWCLDRGKTQTPTLSVQLSGNMPIARRKNSPKQTISEEKSEEISLSQRLNNARNTEIVDEKLYPELESALKVIAVEFEKCFESSKLYGISLKQLPAEKAENIPSFLQERILNRMKSYKTMHVMEAVREERPQIKSFFSSILESKPIFDTRYCITQNYAMPNCFQAFGSKTDGFLPSSAIFFYVCPLQASIAILSGYYFDRSYNEAESNFNIGKIQHRIYSIADFREGKFVPEIGRLQAAYQLDLGVEINERLSRLEEERRICAQMSEP